MSTVLRLHAFVYERTNGLIGHRILGVPCLMLRTTGRRSGQTRVNSLVYAKAGDRYIVVASKGGDPKHPVWYTNLVADPEVHVQVKGEKFAARARVAAGEERARLWDVMAAVWPDYNDYRTKTSREIPIVVLDPVAD